MSQRIAPTANDFSEIQHAGNELLVLPNQRPEGLADLAEKVVDLSTSHGKRAGANNVGDRWPRRQNCVMGPAAGIGSFHSKRSVLLVAGLRQGRSVLVLTSRGSR